LPFQLNVIVGVGILGLPFVFLQVGIVFGFVLLGLIAMGTGVSFWFLLQASDLTRQKSYEAIANHTLGRVAAILTKILIIVDTFGSLSAFLVVSTRYNWLSALCLLTDFVAPFPAQLPILLINL